MRVASSGSCSFGRFLISFGCLLVCYCFNDCSAASIPIESEHESDEFVSVPPSTPTDSTPSVRVLSNIVNASSKVGTLLITLYNESQGWNAMPSSTLMSGLASFGSDILVVESDRVLIEAVASGDDTRALVDDLVTFGFVETASFSRIVSGFIPITEIAAISNLETMNFAYPALSISLAGTVTSEGDAAMDADTTKSAYGLDGDGIIVGVLSDSYNCLGGAGADIVSGDLPPASMIRILDDTQCTGAIDEGRAMMQIVHDVAPKAGLVFHTASGGMANFAKGIIDLKLAGANVIVDDFIYLAEPMFQDGIIAQAVDKVKSQGTTYFSSAGNSADKAHQMDRPVFVNGFAPQQTIRLLNSGSTTLFVVVQWDEPFYSVSGAPGCQSNIDVSIFYNDTLALTSAANNIGSDAIEMIAVDRTALFRVVGPRLPFVDLKLEFKLVAGPAPTKIKYVIFGDVEVSTKSATSYGHCNAKGGIGVGAAYFQQTPRFGTSPPVVEIFSALGGVPILFDILGNRLAQPEIRQNPLVVGPDGGQNSFFPPGSGTFRFFGTSAAAPHVAAVAALMLHANSLLTPADIYNILSGTAIDMDDPSTLGFDTGFDSRTGFGLVNALAAVYLATISPTPTPPPTTPPTTLPTAPLPTTPPTAAPLPTAPPTTLQTTPPTPLPTTPSPSIALQTPPPTPLPTTPPTSTPTTSPPTPLPLPTTPPTSPTTLPPTTPTTSPTTPTPPTTSPPTTPLPTLLPSTAPPSTPTAPTKVPPTPLPTTPPATSLPITPSTLPTTTPTPLLTTLPMTPPTTLLPTTPLTPLLTTSPTTPLQAPLPKTPPPSAPTAPMTRPPTPLPTTPPTAPLTPLPITPPPATPTTPPTTTPPTPLQTTPPTTPQKTPLPTTPPPPMPTTSPSSTPTAPTPLQTTPPTAPPTPLPNTLPTPSSRTSQPPTTPSPRARPYRRRTHRHPPKANPRKPSKPTMKPNMKPARKHTVKRTMRPIRKTGLRNFFKL